MNCSMWDELCNTNVIRIQKKYVEINKRNIQRSRNIWDVPEKQLQREFDEYEYQKQKEMKQNECRTTRKRIRIQNSKI